MSDNKHLLGYCPLCGHGRLIAHCKGWMCNNTSCSYILYEKNKGTTLNEEDANKLIAGQTTGYKQFTKVNGQIFYGKLKLDMNGNLIIIPSDSKFTNLKCPICKGRIRETTKCFICENSISSVCPFIIWKKWHGHIFTLNDIHLLSINRQTIEYSDFKNNLGQTYSAKIKLDIEGKPFLNKTKQETSKDTQQE